MALTMVPFNQGGATSLFDHCNTIRETPDEAYGVNDPR